MAQASLRLYRISQWEKNIRRAHQAGPYEGTLHRTAEGGGVGSGGLGRAILEVATSFGVAWWTVQAVINTAAAAMANPDARPVRRLGVDEHRYRRVRFFRDPTTAKWCRYEPWMTTMVDLDTGVVLGVVDGRGSTGVKAWLEARSAAWRGGVQVVAIDPRRRSAKPSLTPCPGLDDLIAETVADMQEQGEAVPQPLSERRYSGKFNLRLGESLHRRLAIEAAEEQVSLNQLVIRRLMAAS